MKHLQIFRKRTFQHGAGSGAFLEAPLFPSVYLYQMLLMTVQVTMILYNQDIT